MAHSLIAVKEAFLNAHLSQRLIQSQPKFKIERKKSIAVQQNIP